MPYQMTWLIPDKLLYVRNNGIMTADEIKSMYAEMAQLSLETSSQAFYFVVDSTEVEQTQVSAADLQKIFPKINDNRLKWTVTVNPNLLQRFFATLIFQFMGIRGCILSTPREAFEFLCEQDETLPKSQELLGLWQTWQDSLKIV